MRVAARASLRDSASEIRLVFLWFPFSVLLVPLNQFRQISRLLCLLDKFVLEQVFRRRSLQHQHNSNDVN